MKFVYQKVMLQHNENATIYQLNIWQASGIATLAVEKIWVGYTVTNGALSDTAEIWQYLQRKGIVPSEVGIFGAGIDYWNVEAEIEKYMNDNHILILQVPGEEDI